MSGFLCLNGSFLGGDPAPQTVLRSVPAGESVIVAVLGPGGVTDSEGNTYNLDATFGQVNVYRSVLTSPLTLGASTIDGGPYAWIAWGGFVIDGVHTTCSVTGSVAAGNTGIDTTPGWTGPSAIYTVFAVAGQFSSNTEPDPVLSAGVTPRGSVTSGTDATPDSWRAKTGWDIGGTPQTSGLGQEGTFVNNSSASFTYWVLLIVYRQLAPGDDGAAGAGDRNFDLAQLQSGGAIVRAYRNGANGRVDIPWGPDFTAGEVTFATDLGSDAAPTLARGAHDHLFAWYHNASDHALCKLSKDLGRTWSAYVTHATTKRYPRACILFERTFLAAHDGSVLRLYTSLDWGLTLTEQTTFPDAANARVALFTDGREWVHLVYRNTSDNLVWRYYDGKEWSSADTWVSGFAVASSTDWIRGVLAYFTAADVLTVRVTNEDGDLGDAAAAPAGTWEKCYMGTLVDQEGKHFWLAGRTAAGKQLRYSKDYAATWGTPT